jgi:biotin carboxyl carrier protein
MKYYVTVHDEEMEVELSRQADGSLQGTVGGQTFDVDLSVVEHLRRYSLLLNQESYDVVVDSKGSDLHLQVGAYRLNARVEDERQRAARSIGESLPQGPTTMTSVMPGVLRAIFVKAGDQVEEGQALLILEAMKMENEIRAPQSGLVREVLVSEGNAVEGGAPLLTLEPLEDSESAG